MMIVSLLSCNLHGPRSKMRGSAACHISRERKELIPSPAPMLRSTLRAMDTVDMALLCLQGLMRKTSDRQLKMIQKTDRGKSLT